MAARSFFFASGKDASSARFQNNIALDGTATQTDTFTHESTDDLVASKANDGVVHGRYILIDVNFI